jgi:deoxycytidine triphosphate deaminase
MLTDQEMRVAINDDLMAIEPLCDDSLQAASYDMRVGDRAFVSGDDAVTDVANKGLVIVEPGEFAVVQTLERVHCGPQVAGQIGLASTYARQGLTLLSGPQIDPGFDGVLVVRVTNLAPRRITLPYGAPFLTTQFFRLKHPVAKPYTGARQGQTGIGPRDIEQLTDKESPTIGGMVRSLATLAEDVGDLKTSVKWIAWAIPVVVTIGMAVIGVVVALK